MTITRPASFLNGAFDIVTDGLSSITVTNNASIQFDGDFSISWHQKLTPNPTVPSTYVIFGKGDFTNSTKGAFSYGVEVVAGQLKFSLGGYTGSTGYIITWTSNNPIVNSSLYQHYCITWVHSTKTFKLYLNGVEQAMTISGTASNLSSLTGSLDTSNLVWFTAPTKSNFIGRIAPNVIVAKRAFTSAEIYSLYTAVQYTGSYPSLGTICYSRWNSGLNRYELYTMKEDGTEPTLLFSAAGIVALNPKWNIDGTKIAFVNDYPNKYVLTGTGNSFHTIDSSGGNYITLESNRPYAGTPCWLPDGNILCVDWVGGTLPVQLNSTNGTQMKIFNAPNPPFDNSGATDMVEALPTPGLNFFFFKTTAGNLYRINIDTSYNYVSHSFIDSVPAETLNPLVFNMDGIRISPDGTNMIYAKRAGSGDFFNIWKRTSTGGSPVQLTFGTNYHSISSSWSPDGTKILFSENSSGFWQLKTMNADGSNVVNLSTAGFHEVGGHWKA